MSAQRVIVVAKVIALMTGLCTTSGCAAVKAWVNEGGKGAFSGQGPSCLDYTSVAAIDAFDFRDAYDLDKSKALSLKSALVAASVVNQTTEKLDSELGQSCSDLAAALSAPASYTTTAAACNSAAKAIAEMRRRFGKQIGLVIREPVCIAVDESACDSTCSVYPYESKTCLARCHAESWSLSQCSPAEITSSKQDAEVAENAAQCSTALMRYLPEILTLIRTHSSQAKRASNELPPTLSYALSHSTNAGALAALEPEAAKNRAHRIHDCVHHPFERATQSVTVAVTSLEAASIVVTEAYSLTF